MRKSYPQEKIGVCSVKYRSKDVVICPNRFLEDNTIFKDCVPLLSKTQIDDEIFVDDDEDDDGQQNFYGDDADPLYEQALDIVLQSGKASASYIQRRLSIGYNRAARLVEEMEERGIVGPANGSKPREIIHVP